MHFPRLKAALGLLALTSSASAMAQEVPDTRCSGQDSKGNWTYGFTGRYTGSSMTPSSASGEAALGSYGGTEKGVELQLHEDGGTRILAWTKPSAFTTAQAVTAVLEQGGSKHSMSTSRTDADQVSAYVDDIIDFARPAMVTFFSNGEPVGQIAYRGEAKSLPDYVRKSAAKFAGHSPSDFPNVCSAVQPSSTCFLTTATVDSIGLADDCWELRSLRRFRDTVMMGTDEGRAMVDHYYATAPAIVAGINRQADAKATWLRTYWTGILPSAVATRLGLNRLALRIYRGMIASLEARLA